jgi:phosphotransferase system enzyme I (PtsP)
MCDKYEVPVSLCGELGGRPLEAMTLLGLGFRSFSVPSASVGPVKRMVRSANCERLETAVGEALASSSDDLREQLKTIADAHGVKL